MELLPDFNVPENLESDDNQIETSLTYKIDFEKKQIVGMIDGKEAIKQFIYLALNTERFKHVIYSFAFGNEAQDIIRRGYSPALLEVELERAVTEAIIYDERIEKVSGLTFEIKEDEVHIYFIAQTIEGDIEITEVFSNV